MIDDDIESFIKDAFESNYEFLKEESGHALSPELKTLAFNEVLYYWRKLKDVALNVTDTEVKLSLPNQKTPNGNRFTLEGVVDIIRGRDRTVMYDIKTHDPEQIDANLDDFAKQLNVYAYIWQHLRGEKLDETAVIATTFPKSMRKAMTEGNQVVLDAEFSRWEPVKPIRFEQEKVNETIKDFAATVDLIENNKFKPLSIREINTKERGMKLKTATWLCRNCDSRFSCDSYRKYALESKTPTESQFRKYINDLGDDDIIEDHYDAALERAIEIERE